MEGWGRYLDRGFVRQEAQIDGVPCQWIRTPRADPDRVVLYLHGGGFCTRTPVTHGQLLANICGQVGATGLMPDYRLAPEHPFPASFEDCFAVYRWLLGRGIKPGKIVLAGDSAGGTLTLGTLLRARDEGLALPACAVMISPWSGCLLPPQPGMADHDAVLSRAALKAFFQAWKPDLHPDHPLSDLTGNDFSGLPPMLFQAGGEEILLPDAIEWAEKARAAGVEVALQIFPGMPHAFQVASFLPETKTAIHQIATFMSQWQEMR